MHQISEKQNQPGKTESNIILAKGNNGNPLSSIGNCVLVLSKDPDLKNMFRYNALTDKIEVVTAWWKKYSPGITDTDVNNIRLYIEQKYALSSEKNIPRAIDIIAHQKEYHPIREMLKKLKWDGGKRIGEVFPRYLGAERCEYTTAATTLMLLGAITRVFEPGSKVDTMVCLIDPVQGGGKSTMARFFAIRDEWFSDDIKNLDRDANYEKLGGHWIIEFSEMLATSNTKTVEAIKSFLSRQKDSYRTPYERFSRDILRQNIFIGTTNNLDFLPDDKTGNRRFIPIRCNKNKAEIHPLKNERETREYILQVWAEAMTIYSSGKYSLAFPENLVPVLEDIQKKYSPEDARIGIIQEWLDKTNYNSVCSIMIFREALGNEYTEPKQWELRDISSIMNNRIDGWKRHPTSDSKVRFTKYGKQRAWDRILSPTNGVQDGFIKVTPNEEPLPFS